MELDRVSQGDPLEILIPVLTRDHLPDPVYPERLDPCSRFPRWSTSHRRNRSSGLIQITLTIRASAAIRPGFDGFVLVFKAFGDADFLQWSGVFPNARLLLMPCAFCVRWCDVWRMSVHWCCVCLFFFSLFLSFFFLSVASAFERIVTRSCNIVIFGHTRNAWC